VLHLTIHKLKGSAIYIYGLYFSICFFFGKKGLWGVKINQERSAIAVTAEKMFHKNHLHKKGYDQELLINYFQTMAVKSMVY
jgi:hypothetical protein